MLTEFFACINDSHVTFTSSSYLLPSFLWSDDFSIFPVRSTCTFDRQIIVKDFIARNRSAKGLIIDMRNHLGQQYEMNDALIKWLAPEEVVYLWTSVNDKSNPGNFVCNDKVMTGTNNPDHFTGKVAILVNEATMSVGEIRSMAYRNAVNSKIIGTTTSGAVGPFGRFNLPGGINFTYSANGLYYPDWELFQRKGVKIDITVKQTAEDIKNDKDLWMEEAIRYILND